MELILADLFETEFVRRAMEVFGESPDRTDIGMCGSVRVIPALEFLEHLFS
jgi:hypothetical protein